MGVSVAIHNIATIAKAVAHLPGIISTLALSQFTASIMRIFLSTVEFLLPVVAGKGFEPLAF